MWTTSAQSGERRKPVEFRGYLDHLRREGDRIAFIAPHGLDRPIPACPPWNVRKLLEHLAKVYDHKVMAMRLGRKPNDGEWVTDEPYGKDTVEWFGDEIVHAQRLEVGLGDCLGAHLAQNLENKAFGLRSHGVTLAGSRKAVSGSPGRAPFSCDALSAATSIRQAVQAIASCSKLISLAGLAA